MSTADTLDLDEEVRAAWAATLGESPGALSWEEAGGDSLATLHLLYRLEQRLGRTLSFELMQPGMTAGALVAALRTEHDGEAAGLPCLFLVPGIHGDEPSLANLRRGLAASMRFELALPPGLDAPAKVLRDMPATGAAVARDIDRRQPAGPVLLGGYSFGASVALEAAAALAVMGREVALIAVLDAAFGAAMRGNRPSPWWRRCAGRVVLWLASWNAARCGVVALAERRLPARALAVRRLLLGRLRGEARAGWQLARTEARVFLALSDEFAHHEDRWRALCPNLDLLRLPTSHHGLIRDAALAVLADRLERAVRAAA